MNNWNDEVRIILASNCDIPGCNANDLCKYDVEALDQISKVTDQLVIGEDESYQTKIIEPRDVDEIRMLKSEANGRNQLRANQREAIQ